MQATFLSYIALVIPIVAVLLGASLGNETFDVIDLAGAGSSSWESTSRRPGGRRPSPERRWVRESPTRIPSIRQRERPEPPHFVPVLGRPRPAFLASVQNSSSLTPRLRPAPSRNENTNAC